MNRSSSSTAWNHDVASAQCVAEDTQVVRLGGPGVRTLCAGRARRPSSECGRRKHTGCDQHGCGGRDAGKVFQRDSDRMRLSNAAHVDPLTAIQPDPPSAMIRSRSRPAYLAAHVMVSRSSPRSRRATPPRASAVSATDLTSMISATSSTRIRPSASAPGPTGHASRAAHLLARERRGPATPSRDSTRAGARAGPT